MPTKKGNYIVLVKGLAGTTLVLTIDEAADIANQLLNVAQAARTALDDEDAQGI